MATKKQGKKVKVALEAKPTAIKNASVPAGQARPAERIKVLAQAAKEHGNAGPTARTCPLVLDGELEATDFSPVLCLSCDEFDCRFCEAAAGSGGLRSRLFAAPDEEDGDDDFDDGAGLIEEDDDGVDTDDENIF